jgi:hypothetical protein
MASDTRTPDSVAAPHWSAIYAFGLPAGSVRALLTLGVVGTAAALTALMPSKAVPDAFRDLTFLILGHYFALRRGAAEPMQPGPGPLFLPRGSIRFLMMAGYIAVIAILFAQKHEPFNPRTTPGVYSLIIITGFLLGTMLSFIAGRIWTRGRRPKRIWSDLRASLALLAAFALILLAWNDNYAQFLPQVREGTTPPITPEGVRHVLAAIVAFYFGARS